MFVWVGLFSFEIAGGLFGYKRRVRFLRRLGLSFRRVGRFFMGMIFLGCDGEGAVHALCFCAVFQIFFFVAFLFHFFSMTSHLSVCETICEIGSAKSAAWIFSVLMDREQAFA